MNMAKRGSMVALFALTLMVMTPIARAGCDYDCVQRGTSYEHCVENLSNEGLLDSCNDSGSALICCEDFGCFTCWVPYCNTRNCLEV